MSEDLVFRRKLEEAPVPETPTAPRELVNDDITGATKAAEESDEPRERVNALENWELQHGKYGVDALGVKEVIGEFPYKMQFGALDSYIKGEIADRGWEPSPKTYQKILEELEGETGTEDMEVLDKMKKLFEYVKVVKKYKELKKKKESFGL